MREWVFGIILVGAAAAGVYFVPFRAGGGDAAYAMSMGDARKLLGAADLRRGQEPFGKLDVLVTSPSEDVVRYEAKGSFAALDCRAKFDPVGDNGINVTTSCKRNAMDGASAKATADMTDIAFAEYVASVLGQRPFNEGLVQAQTMGAVVKQMPAMQHEALKMQREMADLEAREAARSASGHSDADWGADHQAYDYAPDASEDGGW
ncbi:MAG: hypothetical protein BGO57_12085 [Sphingomonadales bacterium 63-6]|nr:MAG: hypothetical protein BGO57_12085 [Sphingomonadales bacterium 63-6]